MDIASLSQKCDIPQRKLRYVLDHRLIPGLLPKQAGRGNARRFTEREAMALTAASALFQAGVPSEQIRALFTVVMSRASRGLLGAEALHIGSDVQQGLYLMRDGAWIKLPKLTAVGQTPMMVTTIDLTCLRQHIQELAREHTGDTDGQHGGGSG